MEKNECYVNADSVTHGVRCVEFHTPSGRLQFSVIIRNDGYAELIDPSGYRISVIQNREDQHRNNR